MNSSHRSQNGGSGGGGSSFASRTDMSNTLTSFSQQQQQQQQQQQYNTMANGGAANLGKADILMHRLVAKLAAQNVPSDVGEKKRQEFVSKSYAYLNKVVSSDSFTTSYDSFELAEKIKKKLMSQKRVEDAQQFMKLESRFSKIKIVKNRSSLLQFFYVYFIEMEKFESSAKISTLSSYSHERHLAATPNLTEHVTDDLVNKSETSKKLYQLFRDENSTDLILQRQRPKPLVLNENYILRELIYALQGVDGKVFQKDPKDMQSLAIKVEIEQRSVRAEVQRFLECGWLYLRLRKFLSTYNNNPSAGLVLQAFCAFISAELKEYHRLLAVLESQLGDKGDEGSECSNLTLRRLLVWLEQPLERLKFLNIVCDAIKDKKGGILLSTLHSYSINGDINKSSLLKNALAKCAVPIRDMILEWIYDGQIRDQHEEFFVSSDTSVANDRLWHDKYRLRPGQIPTFINEEQANKILVIGKSINFMRMICNEKPNVNPPEQIPSIEGMLDQKKDLQFQEMIDLAYSETSSSLIDILMKKYKLMDHFNALRRYLLLGQGDFIRHLMDLTESELNKPAPKLVCHNLQRLLDKAVSETNAQFEPSYILSCLDVRLLTSSPNDVGWDVFSLDYNVEGPLKTIFTHECLLRYLRIFNFLWRVKRMEYTTCATWRSHKADMEKFRTIPEFYEAIHQSNIISSEMLRLVQNLNFYIMFEVLEVSWKRLQERLDTAKDMDDVIEANETFLDTIISQLLLDQKSTEIASEMRTIFDLIVKMSTLKEDCQKLAISEFEARSNFRLRIKEVEKSQDVAMKEAMELAEKRRFHQEVKAKMRANKNNIVLLKNSFNDMVKKLLEMLKNHSNESLRFLSFRFNFNEYYTPTTGNGF